MPETKSRKSRIDEDTQRLDIDRYLEHMADEADPSVKPTSEIESAEQLRIDETHATR
ncbi:hypothetical protein [Nocardia donostiensis]|uniref:hypothetical protein n=1 Tax=Nocardia donostiensis TaxID=1538463 RepID=UPI001588DCF4|nr:hypothetical protein [Nocardia donostiensis]